MAPTTDAPLPAAESWTEAERWAWSEISAGRPADFDKQYEGRLDPDTSINWDSPAAERRLSPGFLETIFKVPYATSLTSDIGIVGAWIPGDVRLTSIPRNLTFEASRIEGNVWAFGATIAGTLTLRRVWIGNRVWCMDASIGGSMWISAIHAVDGVSLNDVRISGQLGLSGDSRAALEGRQPRRSTLKKLHFDNVSAAGVIVSTVDAEDITCAELKTDGGVHFSDVQVGDTVRLEHVTAGPEMRLQNVHAGRHIVLKSVSIGRDLTIFGSTAQWLLAERTQVGGSLELRAALRHAPESVASHERLSLDGMTVGGDAALAVKVDGGGGLDRMRIGGTLMIRNTEISGYVSLKGTDVKGDLICADCLFSSQIDASSIQVAGSAVFSSSTFDSVVLTGAKISRDLSLGTIIGSPPKWSDGAILDLHNAEVGAIADRVSFLNRGVDPWPKKLDLRGFTFAKVVAFGHDEDRASLTPAELTAWLARDRSGSVQPYVQLAKALREIGEVEKANDILYAGRELARKNAWDEPAPGRWLGLWLMKSTIGYGLGTRYFRVVRWVIAFVLIGVVTLWVDQRVTDRQLTPESHTLSWMIAASLDTLLPIISLDKTFADIVPGRLTFYAKLIFWMLGIAGWALGSFLVAGFAGLTQKQS